jgi:hypothetical protein
MHTTLTLSSKGFSGRVTPVSIASLAGEARKFIVIRRSAAKTTRKCP